MRRIIYTCDKCGKEELVMLRTGELEPKILLKLRAKEYCEKCVYEIETEEGKKIK